MLMYFFGEFQTSLERVWVNGGSVPDELSIDNI